MLSDVKFINIHTFKINIVAFLKVFFLTTHLILKKKLYRFEVVVGLLEEKNIQVLQSSCWIPEI